MLRLNENFSENGTSGISICASRLFNVSDRSSLSDNPIPYSPSKPTVKYFSMEVSFNKESFTSLSMILLVLPNGTERPSWNTVTSRLILSSDSSYSLLTQEYVNNKNMEATTEVIALIILDFFIRLNFLLWLQIYKFLLGSKTFHPLKRLLQSDGTSVTLITSIPSACPPSPSRLLNVETYIFLNPKRAASITRLSV